MSQLALNILAKTEIVNLLDHWDELRPAWDQFVDNHPKGTVFHTPEMIRVYQAAKGHSPLPLAAVLPDGRITALLVAVRVQTLPDPLGRLSSRSILFAEPLCEDETASIDGLTGLIGRHDSVMRRSVLFTEIRPLFAPGVEHRVLVGCGYQYLDYLNYLVDLTKPRDTLWTELHRSARRAIRTCDRRGFEVCEVVASNAVDQLYPLLQLSYEHSGVPLADRSLFDAAMVELQPRNLIRVFGAFQDGTPTAMDVMLTFKDRIYFWYGGVLCASGISPCSSLRWHEMEWAQDRGYAVCDSGARRLAR